MLKVSLAARQCQRLRSTKVPIRSRSSACSRLVSAERPHRNLTVKRNRGGTFGLAALPIYWERCRLALGPLSAPGNLKIPAPSRIFSTQSVRPDFSRVSGKRCPYCPRRWVTAQPSIRRSALLTSPPSSRSTVYAVFLPYAMVPIKQITHNVLKLLALPRGLEPLFSP